MRPFWGKSSARGTALTWIRKNTESAGRRWRDSPPTGVAQCGMSYFGNESEPFQGRESQPAARPHFAESRLPDIVSPLLETLASTLDFRQVFARISEVAREILPHDFMCVDLFAPGRDMIRVHAYTEGRPEDPREMVIPEELRGATNFDYLIGLEVDHPGHGNTLQALLLAPGATEPTWMTFTLDALRGRVVRELGLHSVLRVAIKFRGEIVGGVEFASRQSRRYGHADLPLANRIASCLALAIAHEHLAEEQKQAAEANARAERLEARVASLTQELEALGGSHRPVGASKKWRDVVTQATQVAATEATVLLSGESGTGKEVLSRLIHRASPRAGAPFVALNCAALPEHLLESELFGHEKGAFTGALSARPGRIEQAQGGVLFLDEVGEMSPAVQAKLLRVLQEREFQRLGGTKTLKANVRVVAATNRNLERAMERGEFRNDLYYRLHVFEIQLPPLRERPEDILPLIEHFLQVIGAEVGRPAAGVSREARDRLLGHAWPGNVRELRNALERAVILCEGGLISTEHLPIALERSVQRVASVPESGVAPGAAKLNAPAEAAPGPTAAPGGALFALPPGGLDLEQLERDLVLKALERTGQNKSKAARLLGLTRAQLYSRIEKHGLQ